MQSQSCLHSNLTRNTKPAFTLVELLVVIGIIAALISILLPALSRARDASNAAQCMSNLRQQGQAMQMYMSDSGRDFLPPYQLTIKTQYSTHPYIFQWMPMMYQDATGKTWRCPVDNFFDLEDNIADYRAGTNWPEPLNGTRDLAYSYAINFDLPQFGYAIYHGSGILPYQYFNPWIGSKITSSSATGFLFETNSSAGVGYNTPTEFFRFDHVNKTSMNILFVDGHVEAKAAKEVLPGGAGPGDTSGWPQGFTSLWFGQDGAVNPIIVGGPHP
jgi:prepilin-type processing-associated H-X9-DG protein/prepilin-type N-terminal cleavage/methylation domain-containing protein